MIHEKRILTPVFLFIIFFTFFPSSVFAAEYVLPYPSFMPGNKLYSVRLVWEKVSYYWHFGNFSQFKYNLNQSDKYLVEAKTLFEYKQYLLGMKALRDSDYYFGKLGKNLQDAHEERKDITKKKNILKNAALKHIGELEQIINKVPKEITWSPERTQPTNLNLHKDLMNSVEVRKTVL